MQTCFLLEICTLTEAERQYSWVPSLTRELCVQKLRTRTKLLIWEKHSLLLYGTAEGGCAAAALHGIKASVQTTLQNLC